MQTTEVSRKPRFFYGYWVVVAAFFLCFVSSGCGFISFSLFVNPLQAAFDWGRGEIMAAFTLYLLIQGAVFPFIGRILNLYDVRKIIAIGALLFGLGFALMSQMGSLWHFYLCYVLIGVGSVAIGHLPASAIVSNWFEKRRGMAIGIMSTGIGAGALVMAPVLGGYFIPNPNLGWQSAYIAIAVITWILIIPMALFVIRREPADKGLYPDGRLAQDAGTETELSNSNDGGLSLRMALSTSVFWLIAVSYMAAGFSGVGVMQNQAPYLEDIGYPVTLVASTVGGTGLFSMFGMFSFGWLCDRIAAKYAFAIALALQISGIITLMSIKSGSPVWMLWLYVVLMGLGAGGWLPTMSLNVSRSFGLANYGIIFGIVSVAQSIGVATGPLMAGYMYDTRGTYQWAFIVNLVLQVVAVLSILAIRRAKSL